MASAAHLWRPKVGDFPLFDHQVLGLFRQPLRGKLFDGFKGAAARSEKDAVHTASR